MKVLLKFKDGTLESKEWPSDWPPDQLRYADPLPPLTELMKKYKSPADVPDYTRTFRLAYNRGGVPVYLEE